MMIQKIIEEVLGFLAYLLNIGSVKNNIEPSDFLEAATHFYSNNQFDQAELVCSEALKLDSKNYDILRLLALIYDQKNDLEKSIELLNSAIEAQPQTLQTYLDLAAIFYKADDLERSLEKYNDALAIDPNNFLAIRGQASTFLLLKKYEDALISSNKGLIIEPNQINLLDIKGSALMGLHQYEESLSIHRFILAIDPDHVVKSKQGHALYMLGQHRDIDPANLMALSDFLGTDKLGIHRYIQHYEHHFSSLRLKKMNILEIGVGGYNNPVSGGASARLWKTYFPNSSIYSIDIYDKSFHEEERIKIFKGSQGDVGFLNDVVSAVGDFDIIIDDGSHYNEHVIVAFKTLFPHLKEDGLYVVEDTQTSYWPSWGGATDLEAPHTSMNFFKSLVDCLNYEEFVLQDYAPTYFDKNIVAMTFYHNLVFINKGKNNEGSNRISLGLEL